MQPTFGFLEAGWAKKVTVEVDETLKQVVGKV